MLPSRSRLQGWNPDSLSPAGKAIDGAGQSVYRAVRDLQDGVDRLPDSGGWEGQAHDAAAAMFSRATARTSGFTCAVDAVGAALGGGDSTIGAARFWLLRAADDVDEGELQVSDQWVVLIKPARMSAQHAAELQQQAAHEQADINHLLLAVGDADAGTAAKVQAAAKPLGFEPPDPRSPFAGMRPGDLQPGDEVPNPRFPAGLVQQGMIRDQDMATTVRDSMEYTDEDGQHHKTLMMMDGGKHEIRQWGTSDPSVADAYYDKSGNLISDTLSQQQYDGTKSTQIRFGDGTNVWMTCTPEGKCSGGVTTPDGRPGVLPEEFFTHPTLTTVGGGLTALEKQATSGRGIPMLTPESVENVGKAAKFAGPAMGVATALYDTVTAATLQDACVAAFSGAAGVVGGEGLGTAFAGAAVPWSEFFPPAVPLAAMGGNMLGTWTFGYLGGIVGNVVCRP